ncbi:hypothetical protein L6452_31955 [Arctium lappa]|uniref:Uncharacterized protein n=1 Tax=Arctium lappa TaxID=4217 RepID=A0ACB8Z3U7_ARCLA|nr:hypothetical protein L6452_31955 [Arctium lappa]
MVNTATVTGGVSMKKKTKGRKKIEIKKIQSTNSRQVTFSKRRTGLFKKASCHRAEHDSTTGSNNVINQTVDMTPNTTTTVHDGFDLHHGGDQIGVHVGFDFHHGGEIGIDVVVSSPIG